MELEELNFFQKNLVFLLWWIKYKKRNFFAFAYPPLFLGIEDIILFSVLWFKPKNDVMIYVL